MGNPNQIKWGHVAENIEEKILDSIRKGMSSGEDISIRPLREVFQNCDDEAADRFYIRIEDDALYFLNDGNRLTVEFNQNREPIAGTCRMITGISMASKKRDKDKAGNFGTGLRSAHAISHFIEVHGPTTNLIEIDQLDEYGDKEAVLWKENPGGYYFGISNAYNKTLAEDGESRKFSVRKEKDRPKRTRLNTNLPRDGILIRLPWRREIHPGSVDPSEWKELTWNDKKIIRVGELYVEEIPRILLGCSWLREVVLDIDIGKNKSRYAWIRNFNHREFEEKEDNNLVKLFSYKGKIDSLDTGLIADIEKTLKLQNSEEYCIFSTTNDSIQQDAKNAQLLPYCHILMPTNPTVNLPAYTPIALAGNSGNKFGPVAFLPPDDSRTKIKIDGVKKHKQLWGALAINSFTETLLPRVLEHTLEQYQDDTDKILELLPRQVPDKWFSEGRRMNLPSLHHISDQDEYLLNEQIKEAWEKLDDSWQLYKNNVASTQIFRNGKGELIPTEEIIRVEIKENEKAEILEEIFEALGATVITSSQRQILSSLDEEDWGDHNPLMQMSEISGANDLRLKLSELSENLTLDVLGEELVTKLVELIHVNPPSEWNDETNLKRIPSIPASNGKLRPLIDENGKDIFFLASEKYPDLLPPSRRVHSKFSHLSSEFGFSNPRAEHLAELINQAADNAPEKFDNLAEHDEIHKQVSQALTIIVSSNPTQEMRDLKFIPCLYKGRIITRGMSRIEDHVWPIDTFKSNRNNFYRSEMILGDSEEKRATLGLHRKIFENLTWLELHPDAENEREKIVNKLFIHLAVSDEPGVNLIRSLIFAQTLPNLDLEEPRSLFDKDGNNWGVDEWIGEKLTNKLRDEILESLLKLLASAAERKSHGGMVTGWGADNRNHVQSLHLLKNEKGQWSTLGGLCYDLDPDLSALFQKTAVLQEHKDILGINVITKDVGVAGGCGLGVTHRINEFDITEMVESIDGQGMKIRSKIIDMMLQSETEWVIESLGEIPWVPRIDGEFEAFENCILPTIEMKEIFGKNHPWFLKTKCNCDSSTVKDRAKDLGIICDHRNSRELHRALISPTSMWDGMFGNNILEILRKAYIKNPELQIGNERNSRLPHHVTKEWKEDCWLVEESIVGDLRNIYPEQNIVGKNELGVSAKGLEMIENWLLPSDNGPFLDELITTFSSYSSSRERDFDTVSSYWNIFQHLFEQDFPISEDFGKLLFPLNESVYSLNEIMIIDDEIQADWFNEENFSTIQTIDEDHPLSEILKEKFGVIDLSDGTTREELTEQIKHMRDDNYDQLDIDRYWLILSNMSNKDRLFSGENWLRYSATGFDFIEMRHNNPEALIPEKNDSPDEIIRMANDRLPLLWLPRQGELMHKIYDNLTDGSRYSSKLLSAQARSVAMDSDQVLETSRWPALTSSLNNVLDALNLLHENGYDVLTVNGFKVKDVFRTTESIKSRLMVSLSPGAADVYWKDSLDSESILTEVDWENKLLTFTININELELEDSEIISQLEHYLGANREHTRKLVKAQESRWKDLYSCLEGVEWDHQRTEQGMLHPARRQTASKNLSQLYGQCQICGQITPSDREGGSQESVVSLFREYGGRYYSSKIKEQPGNFLYLCPNHFYLYRRSRNQDLVKLPELDGVVQKIKEDPSGKSADEFVDKVLSGGGEVNMQVVTYEKIKGDGEERATEHNWPNGITWKGEHATQFRDALTQYLANLSED
tara:strand:- start:6076 stop:11232 length:5157 start_codon:yes stop_codon:yes gene_type:complete